MMFPAVLNEVSVVVTDNLLEVFCRETRVVGLHVGLGEPLVIGGDLVNG